MVEFVSEDLARERTADITTGLYGETPPDLGAP